MKKILLILSIIITIQLTGNAQQKAGVAVNNYSAIKSALLSPNNSFLEKQYSHVNNEPGKDAEFYMHRSRNYRIVGWVTLGAGVVLSGVGILIVSNENASLDANATGAVITLLGAVSGIVSIPFMIMASVSKHKAKMMMSNQKTGFGAPVNTGKYITGITMTLPIGK